MITAALAWLAGNRTALIAVVAALALSMAINGIQTLRLAEAQRDTALEQASHASDIAMWSDASRKATEDARLEGERRFKAQEIITDETIAQRDKAAADFIAATVAGNKLQIRAAELTAQLRKAATDTASAEERAAAASAGNLLTFMRSRLDEAEDATIQFADSAHIAGRACENHYDSLTIAKPQVTAVDFIFPH